jgi:hypothetical protein
VSWQLSTATTEVLDGGRRRRCCPIIFAGCHSQSPPHRPMWSTFWIGGLRPRFPLLKPLPGCPLVRRHVHDPITESDCASVSGQAQIRPCTTRRIITLPRRYACQKSMRREMRSARPFTVNSSGIDARNGQAYHGRKTTTTNEARPAVLDSCAGEEHRTRRQRRRRFTASVRPRAGAAGRPRVLRAGTEASIAGSSMR